MSVYKPKNMKRNSLQDVDSTGEKKRRKRECTTSSGKKASSQPQRVASQANGFTKARCTKWFDEYRSVDGSEDVVGPEGIVRFCNDLGVKPEDSVMLVISWKLEARQMGVFTCIEWFRGMEKIGVDSMNKLRTKLPYLRSHLHQAQSFKDVYRFTFDFAREKDHRSLDLDTSKALLSILLVDEWHLLDWFLTYLDHQKQYRVLNKDQWYNILEFSQTIKVDLSNYDPNGAWPVLLDEFVEWVKEQRVNSKQKEEGGRMDDCDLTRVCTFPSVSSESMRDHQ